MVARTAGLIALLAASASGAFVPTLVRQDGEVKTAPGAKCAGAPGQPFVQFVGCTSGFVCTGAASDWGRICVQQGSPEDGTGLTDTGGSPTTGATTAAPSSSGATDGDSTEGSPTTGDTATTQAAPASEAPATEAPPATEAAAAAEAAAATEASAGGSEAPATAPASEAPSTDGDSGDTADAGAAATGATEGGDADASAASTDDASDVDGVSAAGSESTAPDDDDDVTSASDEDAETSETPEETPEASETPEESEEESETPEESEEDDGSACFPAEATVELKDGSVLPISEVSIGDMIKVGANQFSKVFMFTHKDAAVTHKFVTLKTASGASLALTKGHYIYADGSLVAAGSVKAGSTVILGNGETDTVVAVGSKISSGLFNPQTVHGDVVVDGVVSSTYTTAVEPTFAHAILAPFRFMNNLGLYFTGLESGSQRLADSAPTGASVVF